MLNFNTLILTGIVIVLIGMILIFIGTALQTTSKSGETGEVKAGGVVMVGPIPIIFGTDKGMVTVTIILAIILMVVSYILFSRWGFR
ncbi:TIGR00304 family membrane protein [Methanobacterium aggregans]|uniref:TIGR00304 family membrane protein n=1 Tax=Methanobacterium aggregans TaxID=1615586 RepID=UPI001AE3C961|nr:TIGR00304 family protein [Methanobacterium aggregans]MBP2046892.1 uncharacterized protein (TIGR00304 family) [Methanobacterium aggregans]